ncbi:MAG: chemoreceptor glutamine deamidase CheD [Gammaproteobacteria bacterium]|nr:chemoreceptor glutamine deamidase CheD [Gammaproteobacteria bacterium]
MPDARKNGYIPKPLPGFESINRYWDRTRQMPAARLLPGEYYVSVQDELITTVLGSCISACIRDKVHRIGGMNHFMLPASADGRWGGNEGIAGSATRYGNYAMEHMINDILKHGGVRRNLEVKVFGGGRIIDGMGNVGNNNIAFIREYLRIEGLPLVGEDLGDIYPRKVVYLPSSGRVWVKRIKTLHKDALLWRERQYQRDIEKSPVGGSVELF